MEGLPLRVGVLGATGTVGQRFVSLLENHPWFKITRLGASERSTGKSYAEVVNWKLTTPLPTQCKDLEVVQCHPAYFDDVDLVFSGLDAAVAGDVEASFAAAGFPVFSNAKNHRYDPHVNADHIESIKRQKEYAQSGGFIVTNANCSCTGLSIALAPLQKAFNGITKLFAATLQAISGAGYPGLPSLDILDNIVPYISGEEEKMEKEPNKILGACIQSENTSFEPAKIEISACCHRVPITDGHTVSVAVQFAASPTGDPVEAALSAWESWTPPAEVAGLPSCPPKPLSVRHELDRPQPRLDRQEGDGMTTVVGRVRRCNIFDLRFTVLSHNTILGAAGGSILNAELAVSRGYVKRKSQAPRTH